MFKIILIRLETNSFANLFLIGCPSQSKGLNSSWVGLVDNRRLYPLPQMDMSEPRMGKNWTSWSLTCVSLLFLAELGDYSEAQHSPGYLSEYSFIPNPPQDFHKEVAKHHQQHRYAETPYDTCDLVQLPACGGGKSKIGSLCWFSAPTPSYCILRATTKGVVPV